MLLSSKKRELQKIFVKKTTKEEETYLDIKNLLKKVEFAEKIKNLVRNEDRNNINQTFQTTQINLLSESLTIFDKKQGNISP